MPTTAQRLATLEAFVAAQKTWNTKSNARHLALEGKAHTHAAPVPEPVPVPGPSYPPDTQLRAVATPTLPRPALGQSITDPVFFTRITCVAEAMRHNYAKIAAWNCDGSLIHLTSGNPDTILDGRTYASLGQHSVPGEARWSNVDPDLIYGVRGDGGTTLMRYSVSRKSAEPIYAFGGTGQVYIGPYEGNLSADDRYVVCTRDSHVWLVDTVARKIVSESDIGGGDYVSVSPSGKYVVLNKAGLHVYDLTMTQRLRTLTPISAHADMGYDAAGNEVIVALTNPTVPMWRLDTGALTTLLPGGSAYGQGHVSLRNVKRPGWAYLSHYSANDGLKGGDQVVAVKLDGSGTVEVFGHAHHTATTYDSEPHACPSPDGSRVVFASDWHGGPVGAFVASAA